MWTIAEYQSTAFFSLRPCTATTSGGKSLIAPTPFSIKMALLDAAIRTLGLKQGHELFGTIRDLRIAAQLPSIIVVNNTFARILRIKEIKAKASEKENVIAEARVNRQWPYQRTIAFREYVQYVGPLGLAFQGMTEQALVPLLSNVNYLGKRGGFFQLLRLPSTADNLPAEFTVLTEGIKGSFTLGTLQLLDDCSPRMTFEHADIYNDKRIALGKERVLHHVVLPHHLIRSSKGYSLYERIDS